MVLSRATVRKEIATGLTTVLVGTGLPVSAIYAYQKGKLGGASPVVLVTSGIVSREIKGLGANSFNNDFEIDCHILIYDGDKNQPLTEELREEAGDAIEAIIAAWVATHQIGVSYRSLRYYQPSERASVQMLDGEPYLVEIIKLEAEAPD